MKKTHLYFALIILVLNSIASVKAQGVKVGDKAPDFTLKNVDGGEVSLQKAMGTKGAIIIFTCNHCPFSKAYEERILVLDKNFKNQGYPVIAINPNDATLSPEDSYGKMQERANEKGYSFPYLYDETQEVAKAYGASRTPHVFLLNYENDMLVVKYIGAIDDNTDEPANVKVKYLEDAINQLLSGVKVAVTETKAIGCTIKWKK